VQAVDDDNELSVINKSFLDSSIYTMKDELLSDIYHAVKYTVADAERNCLNDQHYKVGSDTEPEWLNPPMDVLYSFKDGKVSGEYRTAERYCGLPVYTCIIDNGKGINTSEIASVKIRNYSMAVPAGGAINVLRCSGFAIKEDGLWEMLPQRYGQSNYWSVYAAPDIDTGGAYAANGVKIVENSNYEKSSYNVYVQLWYTKETPRFVK
jgi:hypothetical protein